MAMRKMTFTLPEQIANQFVKRVPAQSRSRFVADALSQRLDSEEKHLIRACEAANQDLDVQAIEREMDALTDEIAEPWIDSSAR
jgi:metal-responsive CopG/Arc/MetJ family transcriptional regulator